MSTRRYLLLLLGACGPSAPMTPESATTTTAESSGDATTPATTTTAQPTTTAVLDTTTTVDPGTTAMSSTSAAEADSSGVAFIPPFDILCLSASGALDPRCGFCDVFQNQCPEGSKCSPYADDGGGSWNNTKCTPLDRDPDHPGEPCTVQGSGVSGVDSCDADSMCWDVDDDTMIGTCVQHCDGTLDAPLCPDGAACALSNDVLALCLPTCDPLLQDCPDGDLCIGNPSDDQNNFLCIFDGSGDEGQVFDPCSFANACDAGLLCQASSVALECDPQDGCCTPYCDLTLPPNCPGAMQTCQPYFEMDPPPEYMNVGVCAVP